MSGSGISCAIRKSAPRSRQITMPVPHHSVFYRPDAFPATQPTASRHWRHIGCRQFSIFRRIFFSRLFGSGSCWLTGGCHVRSSHCGAHTVTPQARALPPRLGIRVQPSGCFPSFWTTQTCCFLPLGNAGCAEARLIQSFKAYFNRSTPWVKKRH